MLSMTDGIPTVAEFELLFVDKLIFWSSDVAKIDRVAMELCKLGVALE
jgi:hypothetical protein